MTTTTQNIEAIDRLLKRGQAVPSKMIRDLLTDCNVYRSLSISQDKKLKELEAELKAVKEGVKA